MTTQHSSKFSRSTFVAALAALALAATACGGGGDSADAPLPTDAPTTTVVSSADPESAPETTSPPETTTSTTALEPEPVPEPEPEVATEPEPEQVDEATEGHDEVEGFEDVEPVEQDVICGEGLTLMEEFVTDTDNGCRAEMCDDGRDDHGNCALPPADEPMTEEEVAELPTETIPYEEYGLEGCTAVSLGMCNRDGVLFCYDTVEGWAECPGQPSGDPCEQDETDDLSFTGSSVQTTGQIPEVTLTPGTWTVSACVTDNDVTTGVASPFQMALIPDLDAGHHYRLPEGETWANNYPAVLFRSESVVDGEWSRTIIVPSEGQPALLNMEVAVTAEGGGTWVIIFRPSG